MYSVTLQVQYQIQQICLADLEDKRKRRQIQYTIVERSNVFLILNVRFTVLLVFFQEMFCFNFEWEI